MALSFIFQQTTFSVGDRVSVYQKIVEEGKTRSQVFDGLIIAIRNRGDNQSFTVRRIASNNIGVERIFPVKSPNLEKIVLKTPGQVRRAKLYYLRSRTGRQALRVKEAKKTSSKTSA